MLLQLASIVANVGATAWAILSGGRRGVWGAAEGRVGAG
eukprot:COSAG02_NODE_32169_length_521_cov_0.637441_2_plen_38_part_01